MVRKYTLVYLLYFLSIPFLYADENKIQYDCRQYERADNLDDLIYSGSIKDIFCNIEDGYDVDRLDAGGFSALTSAVSDERPEIVELLIDRGADVNLSDITPIEFAVGNLSASFWDISEKSESLIQSSNERIQDNVKILMLLLDAGAEFKKKRKKTNDTSLIFDLYFNVCDVKYVKYVDYLKIFEKIEISPSKEFYFYAADRDKIKQIEILTSIGLYDKNCTELAIKKFWAEDS